MKRKKCPLCKKKRRFIAGDPNKENWVKVDNVWYCIHCTVGKNVAVLHGS